MAGPNLFQTLDPIERGSAFVQPLSITSTDSDPNGWTVFRLSVVGSDGTVVTVGLADMAEFTVTGGAAPWTVTADVPFTKSQTLSLPAGGATFQLDYVGASPADQDVIASGTVDVFTPDVTLP